MSPTKAAIAAFCILVANSVSANDNELREMVAGSDAGQFVITNQPCEIDFKEPTPFKYHGYVVLPDGVYAACWYGDDAAIWMAVDEFRQIVSLDPNAFRVKPPEPKQESF
jgi:hypothetical protein